MFKLKLFNFREAGLKTPFVFQKVTIFLKLELPFGCSKPPQARL